ncbi:MAG: hypothetical protein M1832_003977 [Thelocarpon impressellum]|nr:MAG: hypothetical protein M1832_003977 [Thelocarpon impressellum]
MALVLRRHWVIFVLVWGVFYLIWTHVSWAQLSSQAARLRLSTADVQYGSASDAGSPAFASASDPDAPFSPALLDFWAAFSRLLVDAGPTCRWGDRQVAAPFFDFNASAAELPPRPDLLALADADVADLQAAHARFVTATREPRLPQLPYEPETEGIVTTASGPLLPVLVVSLRMLRRTGSTLPVEVFLEPAAVADVESDVCRTVLPSLGARCVPLAAIFDAAPLPADVGRYQLKAFAVLFSSFERVLLLDADNFPVLPPETLFTAEPFASRGLVAWPDYWATTTAPEYYIIAGSRVPPVSERAASESGQLMVSRRTHAATLLLVAYYNYYGPSHYYRLLSQGAPGEGDKDTFLAAADALGAPYWAVAEHIVTHGYWSSRDPAFHGSAAAQHHPGDDYLRRTQPAEAAAPAARALFMHCQSIKTDPVTMPDRYRDDIRQRMWGPAEDIEARVGVDLERLVWDEMVHVGCELEDAFADWRSKTGICEGTLDVYQKLFGGGSFD